MRSVNLLKVAFDAELLRLRAMMARQGRRAAFAAVALIFALAVLALTQVLGWLPCGCVSSPFPPRPFFLGSIWWLLPSSACGGAVLAGTHGAGGPAGAPAGPSTRRGARWRYGIGPETTTGSPGLAQR